MNNDIYHTLQQYLDGTLTNTELVEVSSKLEKDLEWQQAFEKLTELDGLLKDDSQLMQPSMRFTQNVMEAVAPLSVAKPSVSLLPRNIFIFSLILLGSALLTSIVLLIRNTNFASGYGKSSINLPQVSLPNFSWSILQNDQALMIMGMTMILMLLVMAEMFLSKRRKLQ